MLADYADADGVDRHSAATYVAEDSPLLEKIAAEACISNLEKLGMKPTAITVYWHGPKSIDEVLESAQTGPRFGWVYAVTICGTPRRCLLWSSTPAAGWV